MSFPQLKLTNAGKTIISNGLAGEPITFTKVCLGRGEEPENYADLTSVVTAVKDLSILKISVGDGYADLSCEFSNTDIQEGFWWREIGVFAKNGDGAEVLYAYAHSGDFAEYVPPFESNYLRTTINIIVVVGDAENVSAEIGSDLGFAEKEDLDKHINDKNNPHSVTTEQIGAVSKSGDSMTGELSMGIHRITNLENPVNNRDAATKYYVDTCDIDCGCWDVDEELAIHSVDETAHQNLLVDGNNLDPVDISLDLDEHITNQLAHQNLNVDGNVTEPGLPQTDFAEHIVSEEAHPNLEIDGND